MSAPTIPSTGRPVAYVHAGQIFASAKGHLVKTVLGSCVAICIWSERTGVGGMTHYQLPGCPAGELSSARYGDVAVHQLIARLEQLGAVRADLRAKVFGGARVVDSAQSDSDHLGTRNIAAGFTALRAEDITVLAEDVGGRRGRSVGFQTDDGVAWVRAIT